MTTMRENPAQAVISNTEQELSETKGAFDRHWRDYVALGYSPIPLYPAGTIKTDKKGKPVDRSKSPSIKKWSDHCIGPMTGAQVERRLSTQPNAEIGLCGGYNGLIMFDLDTLDPKLQALVLSCIPHSPSNTRIGHPRKAGVVMCRWTGNGRPPTLKDLRGQDRKPIVEVLGFGAQAAAAGSTWPGKIDKDTGEVHVPRLYRMADGADLPPVWELPSVDESHIAKLYEVLRPHLKKRDYKPSGHKYPVRKTPLSPDEKERYQKYAKKAILDETNQLAKVPEGDRNWSLYRSTCKLGWFVHRGIIERAELEESLQFACGENGNHYIEDKGEPAWLATVESGLWTSRNDPLRDLDKGAKANGKAGNGQPPKATGLVVRNAAGIEPERITWIWRDVIPRGKLSLIAGRPGEAKSQIGIFVAATITAGGEWPLATGPEAKAEIGRVIILQAEDGAADTIIPRLMAAGANRELVELVEAVRTEDGNQRGFNLQADLEELGKLVAKLGNAALIIIDPLSAYLGKMDSHNNAEVRAVLAPLAAFAEQHNVAVLGITHLNKGTGDALSRVMGSVAFGAAARIVMQVSRDQDDDQRRLFLPVKSNVGRDRGGYAFWVDSTVVGPEGGWIVTSKLRWETERVNIRADEALNVSEEIGPAMRTAMDFLTLLLKRPMAAKEVEKQAKEAGISAITLRRARERLKVQPTPVYEAGTITHWLWGLPLI